MEVGPSLLQLSNVLHVLQDLFAILLESRIQLITCARQDIIVRGEFLLQQHALLVNIELTKLEVLLVVALYVNLVSIVRVQRLWYQ